MKLIKSKKGVALLAALTVAVVAAVGGYAYFTASGAGHGSASVGNASNITLVGTITGTLYPDGDAASVSVLATNPGSGSQNVGKVSLASIAIDHASGTYTGASDDQRALWDACDTSVGADPGDAFTMPDTAAVGLLTRAGTDTNHATVLGSLQMNDTGVSQNNCQGAPLDLTFSSN